MGLSLRLRFLAFGVFVFGVGGASGTAVSSVVGASAGAFVDPGGFESAVAEALGAVWGDIGAIMRVGECARVLGFFVAVLELPRYLDAKLLAGLTSAVSLPPVSRV